MPMHMPIPFFVSESSAAFYIYSMLLVIVLLTWILSFRLLVTRRKIGYLSMVVALVLLFSEYVMIIRAAFIPNQSEVMDFALLLLKLLSFIMMNAGIYQLYNTTRKRHAFVFMLICAGAVLVSISYWKLPMELAGEGEQLELLRPLGMELYFFVLIFLSFMLINPRIGQNGKYQLMLTAFFIMQTLHMADMYLIEQAAPVFIWAELTALFVTHIVLFLFIFERIIEIMQAIYQSSITDTLTGLYNRNWLYKQTRAAISQGQHAAILFSDIDNFKKLNDQKGHHAGDAALKNVARIMIEEAEDIGYGCRYGGEELVVLVTDASQDAEELAERIRSRVEEESGVTVSMGVSIVKKGMTAEQLIKKADEAMYQAKTTGKNKVVAS